MAETVRETNSMPALLANAGKVDVKWDALPQIVESYQKGKDWSYQQGLRNIFKDDEGGFRSDLLDANGQPDSGKMWQRLMAVGGAGAVEPASKLAESGMTMDRYRNAPAVQAIIDGRSTPSQPSLEGFPRSGSQQAPTVVAPPLTQNRPGSQGPSAQQPASASPTSWRGGDSPNSLISFLSANGIPEQDQGSAANIIGGQLSSALGRRVDPNAPLDMADPQVRQVLAGYVRQRPGAVPAQATQTANAQPQVAGARVAGSVPPQADPTLGGLVPPGYEPGAYLQRLNAVASTGRVLPDQLKVLEQKIAAIQSALQPTTEQKNARAAGMSVREYLDRNDVATTDRAVLTNSVLPKLDKSQDVANAARDEIMAIHRAREQLDAPGGMFTGTAADTRLKLAKVAEFLGVPNADKIANTEAFGSAIGARTLSLVKGLGAGSGISNADRDFAAAMAGGNIKLDEKSIRRILDIGERAARAKIDQHNGLATRTLSTSDALKGLQGVYGVEAPGQYQAPQRSMPTPKIGAEFNGFRYRGGDPRDQKSWGRI